MILLYLEMRFYKHVLYSFFALLLFGTNLFSQENQALKKLISQSNSTLNRNADSSIIYSDSIIVLAKKLNDKRSLAIGLKNKGQANYYLGNYPKTLINYQEAISIAEQIKQTDLLLSLHNLYGTFYKKQNNLKAALDEFSKGFSLATQLNDTAAMASSMNDMGLVYQLQNDVFTAIDCFTKSLKLYQQQKSKLGESYSLNYLAEVYANQKKYTEAINFLNKALALRQELADTVAMAINLVNLGEVYLQQGNESKALFYFNESAQLAKKTNYSDLLKHCYKMISDIHLKEKNFEKAFAFFALHTAIKDSLYNESNSRIIQETEAKYQNEKKQLQIDNLNKENEIKEVKLEQQSAKTRNLYFIAGFLLVIVFGVFVGYRNKQKANQLISEQKREVEKQKAIIEQKQKEVLDSIHYAKRIQQSLLPNEKYLEKTFNRLKK